MHRAGDGACRAAHIRLDLARLAGLTVWSAAHSEQLFWSGFLAGRAEEIRLAFLRISETGRQGSFQFIQIEWTRRNLFDSWRSV
jgi:hypothetical protein